MEFFDKKFISGFCSGIAAFFTIISVLFMNPEQMWRWLLYNDSNDVKVNRALTKPDDRIEEFKEIILGLQEELINTNKTEENNYILRSKEIKILQSINNKLKNDLNNKNTILTTINEKVKNYELEKIKLLDEISSLEEQLLASLTIEHATDIQYEKPNLEDKTVSIYYSNNSAYKANSLKIILEEFGAKVFLYAGEYKPGLTNIVYYETVNDIDLALSLLEAISKNFKFNNVSVYTWNIDHFSGADFTLSVEVSN